jgi:hypothetical protein
MTVARRPRGGARIRVSCLLIICPLAHSVPLVTNDRMCWHLGYVAAHAYS